MPIRPSGRKMIGGLVRRAGAAMPAGGASGTEAAEEGGTSGTDTPRGESAEGASGIDKLSKPTALKRGISCTTDALRADMRHAMVPSAGDPGRDHPGISNPGRSIHGLFLATANPAGPCGFRTPAELDASIQNGAANPAAAGCRVYTAAAEAARRWG